MEDKVREEVGKVVDPETCMTFAEMQMIAILKEEAPALVIAWPNAGYND